ncbi:hypothetical protein E8E13_007824 [Curvularia kusanoi]|uniref:Uncharacterized protein n=1 Tax=Curvularia kusanoi TaxID=90978 RepID=A0A9P4WDC7_CURKU|nr:hypothetical protein E8E13_007824 [Curvularia kusanoi]
MRNLSGCRVFLLAVPAVLLLFPVSVLVLILERISTSLLNDHTYRDFRSGELTITLNGRNSTGSTADSQFDVAMDMNPRPVIAILGVCVAAYIVCAIDAFGIWELKKVEGTNRHQRIWTWMVVVGNILLAALSLGIFAWTTSVQNSEAGWQSYHDVQKMNQEYTRETWACQIERFFPKEGWASATCGTAKASRFLLIPTAVFSLLALASFWILIRQRGGLKWLWGGKGRYAGFDNVYELQQGGPPAPYMQGPPQWGPQPYYIVPPNQQWGPPPAPQMMPQMAPQMVPQVAPQMVPQVAPQTVPNEQKSDATAEARPVFR